MDQSFSIASISRHFDAKDFYNDTSLTEDEFRLKLLKSTVTKAEDSRNFLPSLKVTTSNGKPAYQTHLLEDRLILDRCGENIKNCFKLKFTSRNKIVKIIKEILKDGTPYTIYRLDISSFFESIDHSQLHKKLEKSSVSHHTKKLIRSFLESFKSTFGSGIPRGVSLSPILSEIYMIDFDKALSSFDEIFFYERFVDDILIITNSYENPEQFIHKIGDALPDGLKLNKRKQETLKIPRRQAGSTPPNNSNSWSFEFLGYQIKITDYDVNSLPGANNQAKRKNNDRKVSIDISKSKIKKFKSKISKAFYSYSKNKDFDLLYDRLFFLASNRDLINKNNKRKIPTGIYYNYPEITSTESLSKIDSFLKFTILSKNNRLTNLTSPLLTPNEKRKLLGINFERGFSSRPFKRFSPNRLHHITRIW